MLLNGDGIHDDTAALQALLDERGLIFISKPGIYLISQTLIIRSNTRLILSPGTKLLAAPFSKCALIENEHFAGGGRDENIDIDGGIWDGNCDNMGLDGVYEAIHRMDTPYSPTLFKGKLIRFAHIDRITLSRMTVRNPVSYGIQIGDVRGFSVRDIFFDYNCHFGTTDGVHINGPAFDGVIENLCGTTNDDMVSLTTYDEPHAEVSIGNIRNISIRNLSAQNGFSAVRLLSGENCEVSSIHIDGIYGDYRHDAVVISNHNRRPGKVWFDQIVMEHIFANKSSAPLGKDCFRYWENSAESCPIIWFGKEARCGSVIIRDVIRHETHSTPAPLVKIDDTASIERLYLENIHQTADEGIILPTWDIQGKIVQKIERDVIH